MTPDPQELPRARGTRAKSKPLTGGKNEALATKRRRGKIKYDGKRYESEGCEKGKRKFWGFILIVIGSANTSYQSKKAPTPKKASKKKSRKKNRGPPRQRETEDLLLDWL